MGFWQNLAESYEENADILRRTYPLSTTSISNKSDMIVIIVIDEKGNFIRSDKIEKANEKRGVKTKTITIPVTEESMGRRGRDAWKLPHPMFDQYEYLQGEGRKFKSYITLFKEFIKSGFATSQIQSIYKYVSKGNVKKDLSEIKPNSKTTIVFRVEGSDILQKNIWEDENVFNAWHNYYLKKITQSSLDYISGIEQPLATFHPKKIYSASANSKLVSANDDTNYTFRGKFMESSQAISIGYESTQKAHQFLRYLINDRGISCGTQVILSFTVASTEKLLPPPIEERSILSMFEFQSKIENDRQINIRAETGVDYAEALKKSINGYKYSKTLDKHPKTSVIALDAATKGRLSITFYRELERTEYLEKIADWHDSCKWNQKFWNKETGRYIHYTAAPSVDKIIEAVYGKKRGGKDESYIKIKKVARERLLRCIFDGAFLPRDYVLAAVRRASNPLGITKNNKFDRNGFAQVVSTACALVCKDYIQRKKGDFKLSIEFDRNDRDYLYGRLLGAADKLEEYALHKKENDRVVTAAIRHMQAFAQHPFRTWQTIHGSLNPYIQKVKGSFAFNEIQSVYQLFRQGDYGKDQDAPLDGSYLIGYYHERAYIENLVKTASEKKNSNKETEKENNNDRQ